MLPLLSSWRSRLLRVAFFFLGGVIIISTKATPNSTLTGVSRRRAFAPDISGADKVFPTADSVKSPWSSEFLSFDDLPSCVSPSSHYGNSAV